MSEKNGAARIREAFFTRLKELAAALDAPTALGQSKPVFVARVAPSELNSALDVRASKGKK